tara:strand:- start:1219 stop:2127 length:909 start_codon:yes stop_codon:yes gene_type:complete
MTSNTKSVYKPIEDETDLFGLPLSSSIDKLKGQSKLSLCEQIQKMYDLPNWTCDRIPRENKYVIKTFPKEPGKCIASPEVTKSISKNYILPGKCKPNPYGGRKKDPVMIEFCNKYNNNDCNKVKYKGEEQPCKFEPKEIKDEITGEILKPKENPKETDVQKYLNQFCDDFPNKEICPDLCKWKKDDSQDNKEIKESKEYKKLQKQFDYLKKKEKNLTTVLKTVRSNTIDVFRTNVVYFLRKNMIYFILFKLITMIIAGYFSWNCGYKNIISVRLVNTFYSCIFSEFYLIYYYFNGKYKNKLC